MNRFFQIKWFKYLFILSLSLTIFVTAVDAKNLTFETRGNQEQKDFIFNIEISETRKNIFDLSFETERPSKAVVIVFEDNKKEEIDFLEEQNYVTDHLFTLERLDELQKYNVLLQVESNTGERFKESIFFTASTDINLEIPRKLAGKELKPLPHDDLNEEELKILPQALSTDEVEPNNTRNTANLLDPDVDLYGRIWPRYDEDFYKIQIKTPKDVIFYAYLMDVPIDKDFDLYLYDSSGRVVKKSINGRGSNENIKYEGLSPGTYYLAVFGYGDDDYSSRYYELTWYYYGEWHWPVNKSNNISSKYGWRTIGGISEFHRGLDITYMSGRKSGTYDIRAIKGGEVMNDTSIESNSCGWWVYLDHGYVDGDLVYTKYCHMESEPRVKQKEIVNWRQIIGYMGATGQVTGKHLHVEVLVNRNQVDPEDYIGKPANSTVEFYWQ